MSTSRPDAPAPVVPEGETERALREALSWALDLQDMCDKRLVQLGDPPHLVYSEVHLAGKAKARAVLASRTAEGTNG